jgi:hypothetical protein
VSNILRSHQHNSHHKPVLELLHFDSTVCFDLSGSSSGGFYDIQVVTESLKVFFTFISNILIHVLSFSVR